MISSAMLEALVTGDLGHSLCVVTRDRGGSTEVAVAGWRLRSNSLFNEPFAPQGSILVRP